MICTDSLRYSVGEFELDVSLEVADGEYFVLLGATGSGKTVLLECICGLREVSGGSIVVDGRDLTASEPGARGIGYVPQDGALFSHLSVRSNIEFGLKVRGVPARERGTRVRALAATLGIEKLVGRQIQGLSGGERQRVALARALASEPSALLLDEPVSALDEFTRDAICRQLRRLQREAGVSAIHVCHSFEEARLVADRIGVIEDGRIVQTGAPDELMSRPATRYVANILRLENVFAGIAARAPAGSRIDADGFSIDGPEAEGPIEFFIRPWDVRVGSRNEDFPNAVQGKVVEFSFAGPMARVKIEGALPLVVLVPRDRAEEEALAEGKTVQVVFGRQAVHVLNRS